MRITSYRPHWRSFVILSCVIFGFSFAVAPFEDSTSPVQAFQDEIEFDDLPLNTWTNIDLGDETQCSEGSDYFMAARRGESDNLIIHFAGGGAAWDAETSSQPITLLNLSGYYFPTIWGLLQGALDGIFSLNNPENPFQDWNVIYIPYCTADFHIGAADREYEKADGTPFTIHHNGRQNTLAALEVVYRLFQSPDKLLISGESAGGFASIFWTPVIAEHYANSEVYQLADGVYLESTKWPEIVNNVWNADTETNYRFQVGSDLGGDAYLQTALPNVTYLHLNTIYDDTLIYFSSKLNEQVNTPAYREEWSHGLRASVAKLDSADFNYLYFMTDYGLEAEWLATPHTSISGPLMYEIEEDDVRLVDWLRQVVIDGEQFSVGAEFLDKDR